MFFKSHTVFLTDYIFIFNNFLNRRYKKIYISIKYDLTEYYIKGSSYFTNGDLEIAIIIAINCLKVVF